LPPLRAVRDVAPPSSLESDPSSSTSAGVDALAARQASGARLGLALCVHPQPIGLRALKASATLGSEFTFTRPELDNRVQGVASNIVNNKAVVLAQKAFIEKVRERFPHCEVVEQLNKYGALTYDVKSPSGFTVTIATDPDVVETQINPMTHDVYSQHAQELQALVFDCAAAADIAPDDGNASAKSMRYSIHAGGGHIHVGLQAFRDARHLLNFLVDQQNHPELALGGLTNDPYNAPPLAVQTQAQRDAFQALLARIEPTVDTMTREDLAELVAQEVFTHTLKYGSGKKYQLVNLQYANNATAPERRTVELRANRPQGSMDDFLGITEVILERISLLSHVGDVLPYTAPVVAAGADATSVPDPGPFDEEMPLERAQQNLDGMFLYFAEMGRDFDESQRFLEPALREQLAHEHLEHPMRPSNLAKLARSSLAKYLEPALHTNAEERL
jgi:hypothetical protein